MLNKALEAFGDLGDDEELGPADWPTVKKYIASLNNLEGGSEHPHTVSDNDNDLNPMNLKDIRIRFLNGKYINHLILSPEIPHLIFDVLALYPSIDLGKIATSSKGAHSGVVVALSICTNSYRDPNFCY